MDLVDRAIAAMLPAVPRPVVRHFADRYMAGESLDDAVATVKALNRRGIMATVDVLGEFVRRPEEANATRREYERLLEIIARERLDATISIKLSALGLEIDPPLARENAEALLRAADAAGTRVRIDMEHSGLTDATLRIFRELREGGYDHVGIVLQSYLRRTLADVHALSDLRPNVRLVKGIYVEPRRIAYRDMELINRNFVVLMDELFRTGSYVAVATHDERLVFEALRLVDHHGVPRERYEFQMLLGVDEELRDLLVAAGERMRIYVPFGAAWYGYSVRRLKENPSIAGYVARDMLHSLRPGG